MVVEEDVKAALIFGFKFLEVVLALLVGVGEGIGELDFIAAAREQKLER
jgi:hypothetical protein